MPISREGNETPRQLVTSRDPQAVKSEKDKVSIGTVALNDSLALLGVCWAIVLFLWFSLRKSNA